MTVRELRHLLFDVEDQDAEVVMLSDYGDHSHTQQALQIDDVEELDPKTKRIGDSAYSQSGQALIEFDADDHDKETWDAEIDCIEAVVVLS